jgi:uncharacterized Zn finger protein
MKLTEKMIIDHFDGRSFERGDAYQENGRVLDAIGSKDQLWGSVAGSQYEPYHVEIRLEGKRISSECSCPVGYGCKHGVTLALEYIRKPESFTDLDEVMDSLEKDEQGRTDFHAGGTSEIEPENGWGDLINQ